MKRSFAMLLCVAVSLLLAGTAMAFSGNYVPGAGITGTPHDIPGAFGTSSAYASNPADPLKRVCIYCHAPHHAYKLNGAGTNGTGPEAGLDYSYLPLWNHALTTELFSTYDPGPGAPTDGWKAPQSRGTSAIGASSLLCLSCHDGTVAVNQYGHAPQDPASRSASSVGAGRITDQYKIGGNSGYLNNHHPIGFDYVTVATADEEIFTATTGTFGSKTIDNFLYGGKMECATCHAVHNTGNSGEKLLYVSDLNSNLCLSCHKKGTKQ